MVDLLDSPITSPEAENSPKKVMKIAKKSKKVGKEVKTVKKKVKKIKTQDEGNSEDNSEPAKKKKKKSEPKHKKTKKVSNGDEDAEPQLNGVDENSPEVKGDFDKFRITDNTKKLLLKKGIKYLFPIQIKCFDDVFDGRDVVAQARTGTGKTMSFALPLVEKLLLEGQRKALKRPPKVLVMAPTRELAIQVHNDFQAIQQTLTSICVYGGASYYPQEKAMRNGLDIVVGTCGRIIDHLNRGNLNLSECNHVVLDEVDQMLDMGFAPSVEEILSHVYTPGRDRITQTLLFSATCPPWVSKTAKKYMRPNETCHIDTIGDSTMRTATTVEHLAIRCHYKDRSACIGDVVQLYSGQHGRAMIFTDTKKEANELVVHDALQQQKAQVLHGDIEQRQREITLKAYREGTVKCLVATNVAARGLDIPEIDLVVQTSPPQDIDSYIHRSGRTGRAGKLGVCVCFYKPREDMAIKRVEQVAGIKFKIVGPPQPKDIVKSSIDDAITSIEKVNKKLLQQFMLHAEKVAENVEGGAISALAAALAAMSGATNLLCRSLLNSEQNITTWYLKSQEEIRFPSYVFNTIENNVGREARDSIKGMRLTADRMGAVFDLPVDFTEEIETCWQDSPKLMLQPAESLPELLETDRRVDRSSGGFGGNSRGFGRPGGFRGGGGRNFGGRDGGRGGSGSYNRGRGGGGNNRGVGGFKRQWGSR